MTFSILTADTAAATWERARRRVLISGSPNSGKTTSLATFPRPLAVMFYPGEKGQTSLAPAADISMWVPDPIDVEKPQNWGQIVSNIERATNEIIAGKAGKFRTFFGDGIHKLYSLYLAEATGGASARGEEFDAKLYGNASKRFFNYVDRVFRSSMDYTGFTVWDGLEKDQQEDKSKDAPQHVYPDLPGRAAKTIIGEVSVALYATKIGPAFKWQLKPQGRVWGCGVKLPIEIAAKLPAFVDQDWAKLEPLLAQKIGA